MQLLIPLSYDWTSSFSYHTEQKGLANDLLHDGLDEGFEILVDILRKFHRKKFLDLNDLFYSVL